MKPSASKFVLAVAGATLVLMLFDVVAAGFHFGVPQWRSVLAHVLSTVVLAYAVWAARAWGVRLAAGIFLLYYVVSYVNTLDEAVLFTSLSLTIVRDALIAGLVCCALVAAALVLLMGKWGGKEPSAISSQPSAVSGQPSATVPAAENQSKIGNRQSAISILWRLVVGDFAYVLLYFVAGICVFPFVKAFYASFVTPSPGSIILMQMFRGLIYIGGAFPILRMMGARRPAALALGLAFSVLGGIAPLLPDNPVMPPNIRLAHTIEIGVSNFIFGIVVAYLFAPRSAADRHSRADGNPVARAA